MATHWTPRPQCGVPGCQNESMTSTTPLCSMHWSRLNRTGDTTADHDNVGAPSGFGVFGRMTRTASTVLCHECGKTFKTLGSHLRFTHDMSSAEYRDAHGIAVRDQLMCQDMIGKIGAESAARVGTDKWKKFEAARDKVLPTTHALGGRAKKRAGAAHQIATSAAQTASTRPARRCAVCGTEIARGRTTCSPACKRELTRIGVAKRDARRRGENENFTARPGSGAKLRFEDLLERMLISESALRARIRRGQFPRHAGREGWFAFWWESDIRKGF